MKIFFLNQPNPLPSPPLTDPPYDPTHNAIKKTDTWFGSAVRKPSTRNLFMPAGSSATGASPQHPPQIKTATGSTHSHEAAPARVGGATATAPDPTGKA